MWALRSAGPWLYWPRRRSPDPFEPSKSAFAAATTGELGDLVIRCLQGEISLLVTSIPSNATPGQAAHLKIVADGQPPRDEENAQVVHATAEGTTVYFGDEATVAYLKGAKKVSVRYTIGDTMLTETFGGSLDDVIQKAMKACGKSSLIEPPPPVSTAAEPGSPEWRRASAACPRPYNFVADKNDKWTCVNDQSGVPVRETAPLPAPSRVGKDCSGIPMEKRTLDCASQYPSWPIGRNDRRQTPIRRNRPE